MTSTASRVLAPRAAALFETRALNVRAFRRRYFVYTYAGADKGFALGGPIREIVLVDGALSVDGLRIAKPTFGPRSISWSQEGGGRFSAGQLFLDRDGIELHGTIAAGTDGATATVHQLFASAVPVSTFVTQISATRVGADTDPNSLAPNQWTSGLEIDLGYDYQPGDALPTLRASLGQQDFSPYVALNVTSADLLQVTLTANTSAWVICEFDSALYLSGTITFSTFGDTFSGTLSSTCADQSGDGVYLWKGQATNNAVVAQPPDQTAHTSGVPATAPSGLSLGDLLAQAPDGSVGQAANAMLVENMKWAMGQSDTERAWLQTFFGQTTPTLPPARLTAIQPDLNWYQQSFAPAYLTWGLDNLKGSLAPTVPLTDTQKQNLQNYLQTGMGQTPAYTRQSQALYAAAYVAAKPRIAAYLQDTQSNWAQQLYDYATSPAQLMALVGRAFVKHDVATSNHFASMLQTLDPTGDLATQYQRAFLNRMLLQSSLKAVVLDEDVAMTWIPEVLQAFVTLNASQSAVTPKAGARGAEDSNTGQNADAQQTANILLEFARAMGSFTAASAQIANILVNAKGSSVAEQGQKASDAFAERYPDYADAANFMFFVAWAGGIFQMIVSFVNFSQLTDVQKATTINNCVALANKAVGQVVGFFKGEFTIAKQNALAGSISDAQILADLDDTGQSLVNESGLTDDWFDLGTQETVSLLNADTQEVATEGTSWENFFEAAPKVVAAVALVTTAVAAVLSTITFARDVQSGKPVSTQALDGIIMAANWAQLVCLTLGLLVLETVFAIAAAIFAVIGLIVMLIQLFMPGPSANQPVDDFMDETGIPFADGLPGAATTSPA